MTTSWRSERWRSKFCRKSLIVGSDEASSHRFSRELPALLLGGFLDTCLSRVSSVTASALGIAVWRELSRGVSEFDGMSGWG